MTTPLDNAPHQPSDNGTSQLAVLGQTYPGYHIERDRLLGRWTATRRAPISEREKAAGIKYVIVRSSPERLGSSLAMQIELTHNLRATHRFTTTS
ncbi:hypothetical protein ACQPYK_08490 [Streptosporangium sp. CA-135522]|uniref:hypothetical protein n=1 Tax=Streptosporangium sp. CA-135522 TaxID=3240072 RepID=UPI003D8E6E69